MVAMLTESEMRMESDEIPPAHTCVESLAPQLKELKKAVRECKFTREQEAVERLLATPPYDDDVARRIEADAARIIAAMRTKRSQQPMLDRFLREYGLSDREGIALMCLAESLLRIPDQDTANRLIADKVGGAQWSSHLGQGDDLLVNASTWALLLAGRILEVERAFTVDPSRWLKQLTNRLGEPVIRAAMRQAMHILGTEFVLGRNIEEACKRSAADGLYSYDMLGEAAREAGTAQRYLKAYSHAMNTWEPNSRVRPVRITRYRSSSRACIRAMNSRSKNAFSMNSGQGFARWRRKRPSTAWRSRWMPRMPTGLSCR